MTLRYGEWFGGNNMITENKTKTAKTDTRKILGSATVKEGPLNIRKTPATDGEIVGQAQKGQRFNVTESPVGSEYTAIIYKDDIRYAMTKYLEVTTN
jgi:uncharacterized protein YgiM (DUF1202 family)